MMNHKLFNKWVLVFSAAFALLVIFMAFQVPLNYWHHSKFAFGKDFAFNEFFPFINVLAKAFATEGSGPITPQNFRNYSIASALLLSITIWLVNAISFQKGGFTAIIAVALLLLTQPNFLWLSVISLKLAMFGIGLVLFIFNTKLTANRIFKTIIFVLSIYLILVSSLIGWLLLPALLLPLYRDKILFKNALIASVVAILFTYLSNTSIWLNVRLYFDNASYAFFNFNNQQITGENLSSSYFIFNAIRHINLAFIPIAAVWFFFRNKANKWFFATSMVILLVMVLIGLFAPITVGIGLYNFLPLILLVAIIGSHVTKQIQNKFGNIYSISVPVIIAIIGIKGILSWFSFSPYNYMLTPFPFDKPATTIAENEGEYLNFSGIELLGNAIENANEGDTIVTNFYHQLNFDKGTLLGANYFNKDLKSYTKGVFIRKYFKPEIQKSGAFPPSYFENSIVKHKLTLALSYLPKQAIKRAYNLMHQGKTGESIVKFKALSDTFPKNVEVYYGLAKAQFQFNYWDDALSNVTAALNYQPNNFKAKTLLGEIYRKQNKNKKALEIWNQSLQIWKGYSRTHWLMGEYYLRLDSIEKAQSAFINAKYCQGLMSQRAVKSLALIDSLKKYPNKFNDGIPKYFISRINSFAALNDTSVLRLKQIMGELKNYIDLDSSNAQLRAHLGIAYMMLENYPKAALTFEKAVELNPNYPQMREYMIIARTNWGAAKFEIDSLEEALFHFRYALDYQPENKDIKANISVAYNLLAQRAFDENKLDEAYATVRAAIFYDRENPKSFIQMGQIQEQINQTDSAEIAYNQAYLTDPANEESILTLIDFYNRKGDRYKVKVYTDKLKKLRRRNKKLLKE
ncbi:MAG: tetratricopeptide repeat protein [Bacteroidia bacterium]